MSEAESKISEPEAKESQSCTEQGKNACDLYCIRCSCLILRKEQGKLSDEEIELPVLIPKPGAEPSNGLKIEKVAQHWCVDSIYVFENMGFSKTVDGMKYLVCAECEFGPLGVHYLKSCKSFLCCDRVVTVVTKLSPTRVKESN